MSSSDAKSAYYVYLETLKIGTLSVFSIFFETAFCIPVIATTPSIPVPGFMGTAVLPLAGVAVDAEEGFAGTATG